MLHTSAATARSLALLLTLMLSMTTASAGATAPGGLPATRAAPAQGEGGRSDGAGEKAKGAAEGAATASDGGEAAQAPKTIADVTADAERIEGLFTLFRDPKTGATKLLVKQAQLERRYIYWAQIANGVVDAGFFKGAYGPSSIVRLQRHFDRIEIRRENTAYWFDPDSPLARASQANISDAVLAVAKIEAEDPDTGDVLLDADGIFASEALLQVKPTPAPDADPRKTFVLGNLDAAKTRILNLRSYPLNTDVEVQYAFHNPAPLVSGSPAVTDARDVVIRAMHSFIAMPDSDYEPRRDDARVGYFGERITDLTSQEAAPYHDLISRWHLVKEKPGAAMSEPVEPIVWWIENTTPIEWRDLIRDAALAWNSAFEKIGFRNAIVVKIQPDDAAWDAGDIRYNVLRWTSSPNPPFGGYGPSFTNPLTGEIIGADVMLEYSFLSRRLRTRRLIQDPAALAAAVPAAGEAGAFGARWCALGHGLQVNTAFAAAAAAALYGMDDALDQQLTRDTMHYLILHELGHTLGLNHNMKATQLLSPDEAFDRAVVDARGLAGSVMDYPAINFAPTREQQTLFYNIAPGPYDDWAIEYGYSEALADPVAEEARLERILSRSTRPELVFGNDADDMRAPGRGIDPRINIYDMSSDAVAYASRQLSLIQDTLAGLPSKPPAAGQSYEEMVEAVTSLLFVSRSSAAVVSRYVGGVQVDRAVVGQAGATEPLRPVDAERQREAMQVLRRQVFAPDAFAFDDALLRRTLPQRRFFDHYGGTEDPKIHDAVLAIQQGVLDHLLHPVVLRRITDSALYGNTYGLGEMMTDLTDAIFAADARGDVNAFRQALQTEYVSRLATLVAGGDAAAAWHASAVAMAGYSLTQIQVLLAAKDRMNVETAAHVQHLQRLIERALSTQA